MVWSHWKRSELNWTGRNKLPKTLIGRNGIRTSIWITGRRNKFDWGNKLSWTGACTIKWTCCTLIYRWINWGSTWRWRNNWRNLFRWRTRPCSIKLRSRHGDWLKREWIELYLSRKKWEQKSTWRCEKYVFINWITLPKCCETSKPIVITSTSPPISLASYPNWGYQYCTIRNPNQLSSKSRHWLNGTWRWKWRTSFWRRWIN